MLTLDLKMIKTGTSTQRSFEDVKRLMRMLFALLYVCILIGLGIGWYLERHPVWTYVATAAIAGPCMILGYFLGIPRGRYLFQKQQKKQNSYKLPK
jgi:hypothetical protein